MNPWTSKALSLPGAVAAWGQQQDGSIWQDDGTSELDMAAIGATWVASGGPGDALPGYWSLDGVDDYLRRDSPEDPDLNLGSSGDGYFWVALVMDRTGSIGESFAAWLSKGDSTYQLRHDSSSNTSLIFNVRGGTGGNASTGTGSFLSADRWNMVVAQQDDSGQIRVFVSGGNTAGDTITSEMQEVSSSSRTGTVGTDDGSRFQVGAQDNSGTLRRFVPGNVAAVAVGTGGFLTLAQMDELRLSTFEEPSEPAFDPANLSVVVSGSTASLSWDASPLLA